ncbi:uncharacterized protein LOC115629612 [Scaptodrosophila lebanonensis]|uniref:Uncharacterized protein LOC115629612 n=1 Tax=Drosophila lebanonensis TaxID=7225 RepID=A0A6J2U3C5_DROLE|nr:uncharacterized protein LOC115629612 [Scaptodrosophila lebanonensis]
MTIKRFKCDFSPEVTTCLKLGDNVRPDCCHVHDPIPYDAECFLKDISKETHMLFSRHNSMFEKRKRLMELALPTRRMCQFVPKCPCRFQKTIEIVHADPPMYTRTEQLALPLVRRLQVRREDALVKGDKIAEIILNRWLRSSYLSLYSRLNNKQPMQRPPKRQKLDKKQKAIKAKYFNTMAKPREVPEPPEPDRKVGEVNPRRLKKLSRPRKRIEDTKAPWEFTKQMKFYKPTERIQRIAKPLIRENVHIKEEPEKVSRNALQYKASARIKEMSQPLQTHDRNAATIEVADDPFSISPNALKYKASSRIKELAEPREFENTHIRENPFAISPAALKAKATPRLIELAKPKGS